MILIGIFICVISLLCNLLLIAIEWVLKYCAEDNEVEIVKDEIPKLSMFEQFKGLSVIFWLVNLTSILVYSSIASFINISNSYLITISYLDYPIEEARKIASNFIMIPYIFGAGILPFLGKNFRIHNVKF